MSEHDLPTENSTEPDDTPERTTEEAFEDLLEAAKDVHNTGGERDAMSPQARLEAARKQLHLAYDALGDIDLNAHSRKRLRREIQEADEAAKTALDLLETHDVDEPDSTEVSA